ncbi:hypothetical protein DWW15_12845 [Subdoligranulum sp. AF14-43]|nr:hypothetical protein DWW15_12845 [Subdoligranulum sp. AF14-43]
MNEYERLIAYMKILYHNLTTLHRNLVKDDAWFGNHKQIGKWYEEVSGEIDDLAETGIALGYKEPSISDAVLAFSNEVVATQPRRLEETYRMILEYFRRLAGMMQAAETIVPVSVQNKLQEYEYDWNKEANFKLAAALGERASDGRIEYDDD